MGWTMGVAVVESANELCLTWQRNELGDWKLHMSAWDG